MTNFQVIINETVTPINLTEVELTELSENRVVKQSCCNFTVIKNKPFENFENIDEQFASSNLPYIFDFYQEPNILIEKITKIFQTQEPDLLMSKIKQLTLEVIAEYFSELKEYK